MKLILRPSLSQKPVAPLAGARIEIGIADVVVAVLLVAPLAGARIEMYH